MIPSLFQEIVFQQHDASSHFDVTVKLNERVPDQWIGREGPTTWPACSRDWTPFQRFQWGQAKESVPDPCPTLKQLTLGITTVIPSVESKMLKIYGIMQGAPQCCYQTEWSSF